MAASSTSTTSSMIANPRAWHHAMLAGVVVFLLLPGVLFTLTRSPFSLLSGLGAFAGAAAAGILADRAPSHWPWYAYAIMALGGLGLLSALPALAR